MTTCRSCRCQLTRQHSYSDFLDVTGGTSSSRDDDDDSDKQHVDNDTNECVDFERLPKYIPQPSTSVLPRSKSEFERLKQRHPSRNFDLSCCYRKKSTDESCACVTPGQSSSKLVDTWSGELQPLSPYEVVRVGRSRRGGYDVWRLEDVLSSRKILVIVTLVVALLGALAGLLVGLTLLEQANSRGSQGSNVVRAGRVTRSQPLISSNPNNPISLRHLMYHPTGF